MRYIAIVHTWNDGSVDYVSAFDNKSFKSVIHIDGELSPPWLKERAALLRLCEINRSEKGETIGRRFSDNMMHVYLNLKEYKALSNLINSTGEREDEAEAKTEVEETDSQER